MNDNNIGIKFHKEIDEIELKNMESNYDILSIMKMKNKEYSNKFLEEFIIKSQEHLYIDGIVSCPYIEGNTIKDILILVPKNKLTHHLLLVSRSCDNYYKELMENYIKNDERLSEKNKELHPLEWTRLMNSYKNTAEEIVLNEYVFI